MTHILWLLYSGAGRKPFDLAANCSLDSTIFRFIRDYIIKHPTRYLKESEWKGLILKFGRHKGGFTKRRLYMAAGPETRIRWRNYVCENMRDCPNMNLFVASETDLDEMPTFLVCSRYVNPYYSFVCFIKMLDAEKVYSAAKTVNERAGHCIR